MYCVLTLSLCHAVKDAFHPAYYGATDPHGTLTHYDPYSGDLLHDEEMVDRGRRWREGIDTFVNKNT